MGPGNDDRRLNSPESALAPVWRTDQRYGTCAHARIVRKRHNIPGPIRDGLLAKRIWDRTKDEWTPDIIQRGRTLKSMTWTSPTQQRILILHATQNLGKRSSSRIKLYNGIYSALPETRPKQRNRFRATKSHSGGQNVDGFFARGGLRLPAAGGLDLQGNRPRTRCRHRRPDSRSSPWAAIRPPG